MWVLVAGLGLIVVAGIWKVVKNPEILGLAQRSITEAKEAAVDGVPRKRVGYRAGPTSFTDRMSGLPADSLLTVRDPQAGTDVKLQVITRETFAGQYQYGSSKDWKPSGDTWQAVLCKSAPGWSRTPVLLVQLDKAGYLLRRRVLGPEDANQFRDSAQKFAHSGQRAGSMAMTYAGKSYKIQDVGVWAVTAKDDDAHLPAGVLARWIVAHGGSDTAIIVEDGQGNNDSVWEGWVVDLNTLVKDVLTPDGR